MTIKIVDYAYTLSYLSNLYLLKIFQTTHTSIIFHNDLKTEESTTNSSANT